ncbi:MAG: SDR family oxidoreductase [Candidatus Woesearchaeota archaeon]|nr:SDR family oxidoreductase [Candidatus Woesearchaeota archaeon]
MATILVTGGAGFIGSHLCAALLAQGNKVLCVDNLFTGSKKNIQGLDGDFEFIQHDIIDPLFIEEKVDQIYNLACPASPTHYQHNPIRTVKANTIGMMHMLGLARKHGARILQASTSEVYGDPREHPQQETYWGNVNPIGIRSCYDEGKRVAETLCFDYHREHNIEIRVARIFNTYGPNMAADDGRVVSNFIVQALAGKPITIYGTGKQTRSFCYVSDMVAGLLALMNSDERGPVNLGNPGEFTVLELAENIIALTNTKSEIVFQELPADDPQQRQPDITLANNKLGWQPTVQLEEGLKQTIAYFTKSQ